MRGLQRSASFWGEAGIVAAKPSTTVVEDVIYVPFQPGGRWGIFDRERQLVPETVDYRGPERATPFREPLWPENVLDVHAIAPDEEYLYLGCVHLHYGHFIINTLARFWPLIERGGKLPPILCHGPTPKGHWHFYKPVYRVLELLGLWTDHIILFDRPTGIRRLIVPSSSFVEQAYAHDTYRDLCKAIGSHLLDPSVRDSVDEPVYFSKSRMAGGVGRFSDEDEITRIVGESGIEVAYPEQLTFKDQINLFSSRKLVAGTLGSAFHTSIFSSPGRSIVGVSPIPTVNSNFRIVDELNANRADYYYSPNTEHETGGSFLTIAKLSDPRQVAHDLIRIIRDHPHGGRRPARWGWRAWRERAG